MSITSRRRHRAKIKKYMMTYILYKSGFESAVVIGQKYATVVRKTTRQLFETIPQELKKTEAGDNGKEFIEYYMMILSLDQK